MCFQYFYIIFSIFYNSQYFIEVFTVRQVEENKNNFARCLEDKTQLKVYRGSGCRVRHHAHICVQLCEVSELRCQLYCPIHLYPKNTSCSGHLYQRKIILSAWLRIFAFFKINIRRRADADKDFTKPLINAISFRSRGASATDPQKI